MLTDEQIAKAKMEVVLRDAHHEHNDCIRMAYEWLDAQKKTKTKTKAAHPLKHIIERWCGRYVSQSDVEIAAYLHPQVVGKYPFYNISTRLTEPSARRLVGIGEAFAHSDTYRNRPDTYAVRE